MPQLVLDARYFSHLDMGVEMEVSINLFRCQLDSPPLMYTELTSDLLRHYGSLLQIQRHRPRTFGWP